LASRQAVFLNGEGELASGIVLQRFGADALGVMCGPRP
jgi:hypothetical protein